MELKKISVGREQKQAFESICELINGGCFADLNLKTGKDFITDGVYVYEYTQDNTLSKDIKKGFEQQGATWFGALRGESVDNDNAIWTEFIEQITTEYHKRYSVLEYTQQPKTKAQKEKERLKVLTCVNNLVLNFFPQMQEKFELIEKADSTSDVYGLSLRMEMSGGTGASVPVLGKVYFEKDGKKMLPARTAVAESIDESLKDVILDDENQDVVVDGNVVDTALGSLESLIEGKYGGNFADYLYLSTKFDREIIENMLNQLSHEAIQIECQRVDVLSISKLKYNTPVYYVIFNSKPALKVVLGASGAISLYCLNCSNTQALIENGAVILSGEEQDTILLDLEKEDLGVDEQTLEKIKEFSGIGKHFRKIVCKDNPRNVGCTCWKCEDATFTVTYNEQSLVKCKDCPYPEVVYVTKDGDRKYTPSLVFAFDKRDMIEKTLEGDDKVVKCACCGRTFTQSALKQKLCPTCFSANNNIDSEDAKRRYKQYQGALSLGIRVKNIFSKKYCYEDDGIIIFVVGKDKYLLDKLALDGNGYLDNPIKLG